MKKRKPVLKRKSFTIVVDSCLQWNIHIAILIFKLSKFDTINPWIGFVATKILGMT
jgi:hypothetical protein